MPLTGAVHCRWFLLARALGLLLATLSAADLQASDLREAASRSFAAKPAIFDRGKVDFSVTVAGVESAYRVFGFYIMPGEEVEIAARALGEAGGFRLEAGIETRPLGAAGAARWRFQAPAIPGLYPMTVVREPGGQAMLLNIFVVVPLSAANDGKLGDYRIGEYPTVPLRGNPVYLPPRGLAQVTPQNAGTRVSPHFTLGQFLCKQESSFPKYLVLREQLVLKLELLLEQFNEAGFRADTFGFISGYRTPYYNARIENVLYSRHTWGDAADIYLDGNGDGRMDDLDGDGLSGAGDAVFFRDFVEALSEKAWYRPFEGGLGDYKPNAAHGPFVHVDCRGFRARWSG
ncbi:MAG: peptidase M15A [Thermoanaerobaculia bacterium]